MKMVAGNPSSWGVVTRFGVCGNKQTTVTIRTEESTMSGNVTSQPTDVRVLYGNLGATSDFWFLVNGNIPNNPTKIRGQNDKTELSFSDAKGAFPMVTVVGHFDDEVSASDSLRYFVVTRCVPHTAIAQRAFALFASGAGGTAEQNWLLAEKDLLGL
jgi:hypothetical protein